ncbi:hypothetical protein FQV39_04500 [Bosea sp. F3-2]|uniref:hypothetical protein n=1 Tax=Bosea sp. F3-2 TaxID=2599640 RepID=UPI0011EE1E39|nr:hypothetical protein [Bosea sp. F3-2]QEL21921.1 hypothetical protein FQV39_04500 [Bosea sp. F3-2]
MAGALRTTFGRVSITLLVMALAAIAWLLIYSEKYSVDMKEEEWKSLKRSLGTYHVDEGNRSAIVPIKSDPTAESQAVSILGSDVALYVSQRGFDQALALARGTKIFESPKVNSGEDLIAEIVDVGISFSKGFPTGPIKIRASSAKRGLAVDLSGEVALVFTKIIELDDGGKAANFGIRILKLSPDFTWNALRIGFRGFVAELISRSTAVVFAEKLNIPIPLPDVHETPPEFKHVEKIPVRSPKQSNWVDLQFLVPTGKQKLSLTFGYPLFLDGGIWIAGRESEAGQLNFAEVARSGRSDARLDEEIAAAKARLARVVRPAVDQSDFSLWLNGRTFSSLVQKISTLQPNQRKATVTSTAAEGQLYLSEKTDRILGKFKTAVVLNGARAVTGSISLSSIRANWTSKDVHFDAQLNAGGSADIKVHIDPGVGGGIASAVKLEFPVRPIPLSGSLQIEAVTLEGRTVLGLFPRIDCTPVTVEAKTDGQLVVGSKWTRVPILGAKLTAPGLAAFGKPMIILSDAPLIVPGRAKDGSPLPLSKESTFVGLPPWEIAEVTLGVMATKPSADGIVVSGTLRAVGSKIDKERIADQKRQSEELKSRFAERIPAGNCPGDMGIAVLMGNTEFGPNNEIVKWARNAWNDITRGLGKSNEAVKILKRASEGAKEAGEALDDAAKQAIKEAEELTKQWFGDGSVAATLAGELVRGIFPPAPSAPQVGGGNLDLGIPGTPSVQGGTVTIPGPPGTNLNIRFRYRR